MDYYSLLGVDKNADAEKIKKAYRKQARKHHPDVNHNDAAAEKKFKDISEAYEVLKDPEKRKAYDQYGSNWKTGPQQQRQQQQHAQQSSHSSRGGYRGGFGGDFSSGGDYSDIFESMFGGGGRRGGGAPFQQKGEDANASLSIPLEDAYHGSSRTITFTSQTPNASGQMESKNRTLNVKVPKGIKDGGKIRLKGQGGPGYNGGAAGDMYIRFDIEKHRLFDVDGADVYLSLPVAPWEAALGAKVNVPTPAGTIKMTIPKGSASGKKMKLKGKGIPAKNAGDLYVVLNVVLPPADDEKARKIYEDMQELNFNPRPAFGV